MWEVTESTRAGLYSVASCAPRGRVRIDLPLLWMGGDQRHLRCPHERLLPRVRTARPIEAAVRPKEVALSGARGDRDRTYRRPLRGMELPHHAGSHRLSSRPPWPDRPGGSNHLLGGDSTGGGRTQRHRPEGALLGGGGRHPGPLQRPYARARVRRGRHRGSRRDILLRQLQGPAPLRHPGKGEAPRRNAAREDAVRGSARGCPATSAALRAGRSWIGSKGSGQHARGRAPA